ncbi:hypothetical protein ACWCXE_18880 [Streptomyces sp. NPDC001780]
MREWKNGIIAAGDDRFTNPNTTQSFYGYQLTSNLMTKGKWDTGFLNSYGTSLIDFERGHARPGAPQLWNEPAYLICGVHHLCRRDDGEESPPRAGPGRGGAAWAGQRRVGVRRAGRALFAVSRRADVGEKVSPTVDA